MEKNNLYPAIFKRKSIRNYDLSSLDENTLEEITNYLGNLMSIYKDIKTELRIISTEDVKRRMMKKAPHYIAAFSENKEGYLANIGFMLQQVDLFLSANGIGCCWQGIPKPKGNILNASDLEYIIVLAFGKPAEPLHRESISEFKRKTLDKITDVNGVEELLEPVRIAPSSTNSQPWFFKGDKNLIHAYGAKPGFLRAVFVRKFNGIDIGIALYHLKLSAEYQGMEFEIVHDVNAQNNPLQGYEYVASAKIK